MLLNDKLPVTALAFRTREGAREEATVLQSCGQGPATYEAVASAF
jgi:hypothetical protein